GARQAFRFRVPQEGREDRDLQHGRGVEVPGSLFNALPTHRRRRAGQVGRSDHASMKDLARNALDAVTRRGVDYADVRVIKEQDRHVSTKNGKVGDVSSSSSLGLGIRVLDKGCWGFAATDDLSNEGVESAAALAVEIARASAIAKKHDIVLAPEQP